MAQSESDSSRATLRSQLEYLNDHMKETSQTANQFLGKFLFGGLLAVIALLNADLVLLRDSPELTTRNLLVLSVALPAVVVISWLYFRTVVRHYVEFRGSHRKLKYKYELTLHALLSEAPLGEYAACLEESVAKKPDDGFADRYPAGADFAEVAEYLLQHHRKAWTEKIEPKRFSWSDPYFRIAMWLVILTLGIRIGTLMLG